MLVAIALLAFPFCMIFAALTDMISMTIANRISVVLVLTFAIVAPMTGMDWTTYGWHFAACFLVLIVTFTLFALNVMGGGDAKLMAAIALYLGMGEQFMIYFVYASMLGGLLTLFILYFRSSPLSGITANNVFLKNFGDNKKGIPYGVALGIAGLIVYPDTALGAWAIRQLAGL